jgi:Ran GTPase-activating protein (RanGAP) involved in mRNA processing and transport
MKDVSAQPASTAVNNKDTPASFRHTFLRNVMVSSLNDARMDLWGEHEQLSDDDLIECVLPVLSKAAWTTLDLRRSRLSARGVCALMKALATSKTMIVDLCLGSITLNRESLCAIAQALPALRLKALSLFDNQIDDVGLKQLCDVLPRCQSLRALNLDNNNITDDGATCLSRALPLGLIERLLLNNNNLTSFGADRLIDAFRRSNLTHVSLRGNYSMLDYSNLMLRWAMSVCKSDHYRLCMMLCSARMLPRIGMRSGISTLPIELIRRVSEALFDAEAVLPDSDDECEEEEDMDEGELEDEDVEGFEEDYLATVAHNKRRWSTHTCSFSYEDVNDCTETGVDFFEN